MVGEGHGIVERMKRPWISLAALAMLVGCSDSGSAPPDAAANSDAAAPLDGGGGSGDAARAPDGASPDTGVDAGPPLHTCEPTRWVTAEAAGGGDGSLEAPWSLAQAMAEASAGDVVLVGPGVYVAAATGERYAPAWAPAQSGSEGAPIVFCAEYPAVHHDTNRSELRNDATAAGTDASPTFGTLGAQHVVWDGFYVNEAVSPSHPDTGPVGVWGSDHVTIARSVIDGATISRADNHNGIRLEVATHVRILNNRIRGVRDSSGAGANRNHAAIMTYDSSFVTIEHNEISDSDGGMYLKGDHEGDDRPNGAFTVRYNRVSDIGTHGITILGVTLVGDAPTEVSHNIVERAGICILLNSVGSDHPAAVRVHHNTLVDCDAGVFPNARETLFDIELTQNLFSGTVPFYYEDWTEAQLRAVMANGWLTDDNHAATDGDWAFERTLTEWQTWSGMDLASSTGDPAFVDPDAGDYHLGPASPAATASTTGAPVGCYVTGTETIGIEPPS